MDRQANGASYDGSWKQNKRNGHGKLTTEDVIYDGEWKENLREGYGTETHLKSGECKEGTWRNNQVCTIIATTLSLRIIARRPRQVNCTWLLLCWSVQRR